MAFIVKARLEVLDEYLKLLTLSFLSSDVPVIIKSFKGSDEY